MEDRKTPLYDRIVASNAKMVSYAGYQMPVRFGNIIEEHHTVRKAAGLFDVSHMSEFWFEGEGALHAVNRLVTSDVRAAKDGDLQYALMCTPKGGVVDDLIIYRFDARRLLLVMNAACHAADRAHIEANLEGDVTFTDRTLQTAQLALQGPSAPAILARITDAFAHLETMTFSQGGVAGVPCIVSRSGYTGEDGYELYCDAQNGPALFDAIMEAGTPLGLAPIGLGARDTLRLEAKLPLYGNELSLDVTPFEARLSWAVALDKPSFIGQDALIAQKREGISRKLVGFEMVDRAIARHGYPVFAADGTGPIGHVTSGAPSPTLSTHIGLAYVPPSGYAVGDAIDIEIRGQKKAARIVKTPFYRRPR